MAEQQADVDVLMMDPPRSGSSEEFLSAVSRIKPKRIVYISCNPETLARDLKIIKKQGYRIEKAVGVDMFPWTDDLEAVVVAVR
jgi:23S rRNA (uracil1939-C5)-methyltransferase